MHTVIGIATINNDRSASVAISERFGLLGPGCSIQPLFLLLSVESREALVQISVAPH